MMMTVAMARALVDAKESEARSAAIGAKRGRPARFSAAAWAESVYWRTGQVPLTDAQWREIGRVNGAMF